MDEVLPTFFLPAERLDQDVIERISNDISQSPSAVTLSLMPLAVIIVNLTRQIVYANARFVALTAQPDDFAVIGLRVGEALGCEHASIDPGGCGTTRFCQYCGQAQAVVKSLKGERDTQECSINRLTKTTLEALNLQVWAAPMTIEGHELMIYSIIDIAHEKALRGFERIFFHDLANALTGVKGLNHLMAIDLPADYAEDLNLMRRGIEDIEDIIETQRDFLTVEAKEYHEAFSAIDSREMLAYLAASCQSFNPGGSRQLLIDSKAQARVFSSDGRIIRRILVNMIKNALEASAAGETVTLGCDSTPGSVSLWVHNPAVLSEEVQLRLFERGFSTKGPDRGFGTYSMRLFARQCLGAEVSFTSTAVGGTRFSLTLPA